MKALFTKGFKSKTVLFGYLLMVLTGLQGMSADIAELFGNHSKLIMFSIGVAVVLLRASTSTSLEEK